MFKKALFLGLVSGILAGVASLIYTRVYNSSLGTDFSTVVQPVNIFTTSIIGCLLAAVAFYFSTRWLKHTGEILFNFVFVILTFASILGPFAAKLPLEMEMPELFPGLT